jgi:hypothetical protein
MPFEPAKYVSVGASAWLMGDGAPPPGRTVVEQTPCMQPSPGIFRDSYSIGEKTIGGFNGIEPEVSSYRNASVPF